MGATETSGHITAKTHHMIIKRRERQQHLQSIRDQKKRVIRRITSIKMFNIQNADEINDWYGVDLILHQCGLEGVGVDAVRSKSYTGVAPSRTFCFFQLWPEWY